MKLFPGYPEIPENPQRLSVSWEFWGEMQGFQPALTFPGVTECKVKKGSNKYNSFRLFLNFASGVSG